MTSRPPRPGNDAAGGAGSADGDSAQRSLKAIGRGLATGNRIDKKELLRRRDRMDHPSFVPQSFLSEVVEPMPAAAVVDAEQAAMDSFSAIGPFAQTFVVFELRFASVKTLASAFEAVSGSGLRELFPWCLGKTRTGLRLASDDRRWNVYLEPGLLSLATDTGFVVSAFERQLEPLHDFLGRHLGTEQRYLRAGLRSLCTRRAANEERARAHRETTSGELAALAPWRFVVTAGAEPLADHRIFSVDADIFAEGVDHRALTESFEGMFEACRELVSLEGGGAAPLEGAAAEDSRMELGGTRLDHFPEMAPPNVSMSFEAVNEQRLALLEEKIFGGGLDEKREGRLRLLNTEIDRQLPDDDSDLSRLEELTQRSEQRRERARQRRQRWKIDSGA